MTQSVDASQLLSQVSPVIAQWVHEQSGHSGRNRERLGIGSTTWSFTHLR